MKAMIAGGGIGGLTCAAGLAMNGWDVTLFERQPFVRASGSGIYIWENGQKVLETLGAYEEVSKNSFKGKFFEQRDKNNNVIISSEIPKEERLISPPRAQLLEGLKNAALNAGVNIITSSEVVSATSRGEFSLADGNSYRADLAVGADGVWSRVRQALGLGIIRENSTEGAFRVMIPARDDDFVGDDAEKYIETWNGNCRLLITPISPKETYLALTCQEDNEAARKLANGEVDYWIERFPKWEALLKRIDSKQMTWGVYTNIKCKAWSAGRTAILGDAAHAQHPNLGQGGGMAMQNALALAHQMKGITDKRDIPDALEEWECGQRDLIDHCQKWSDLYSHVSTLPDDVRINVVQNVFNNDWATSQIYRAASSIPTGFLQFKK